MNILGNLKFLGLGQVENLRVHNLTSDPVSPSVGQVWLNSTENCYKGYDGVNVIVFATGGNTTFIQNEVNNIETSVGLNSDGTFSAYTGTNYINSATSMKTADVLLDSAIKTVSDANGTTNTNVTNLQTEVNNIETAAGLNTDGTFSAFTGTNYLNAATSLKGGEILLDTQLKTTTDAAAAANSNADTRVLRAGDSMTGNLVMGAHKVTSSFVPTTATDLTNKAYVDSAIAKMNWQQDILAVQVDGTTNPGVGSLGDRYILTNVAALHANFGTIAGVSNNDIVEFDGSAWIVAFDISAAGALADGTIAWNAGGQRFERYFSNAWSEFGGLNALNAGIGLTKTGNVLNINLGAGIQELPTDEVGVDVLSAGALFLTVDGSSASTSTAAQLAVKLDGATLARSVSGLKVQAEGITAVELNAAVAGNGLVGAAGSALAVGAGTGITVGANDVAIDLTYADARWINTAGDTMTGDLVLNADPSVNLGAATKQYVDTLASKVNASTYVYNGTTPATVHVVTHGLGFQYCNVTVVDSSDKVIIPDTVTFDTANQLTVTFAAAVTTRVVVTGVKV